MTMIQLRFDCNSTTLRPVHTATCVTTGLLHCGLNKEICQQQGGKNLGF